MCTGMSEGTGPIISNALKAGCWRVGSVGRIFPGVEFMLHNKDEHGEGEVSVCCNGAQYLHVVFRCASKQGT